MLNPDNNLYSVAPVGHNVIIARQVALKGGISRDNAINLLTWLIIATNTTPEEIAQAMSKAIKPTVQPAKPVVATPPVPVAPPVVAGQTVQAFIGEIDPEEQAALDDVAQACAIAVAAAPVTTSTPIAQSAPVVPIPVKTAAPIPTTPTRAIGAPVVPPVPVVVPGMPTPTQPGAVDDIGIAKTWGVPS